MMATFVMRLLQVLLFGCVYLSNASSDYVPVVMLSSPSGNLPSRSVSAVHKISAKEFHEDYLNKLRGQGPLIIFLQDTLSLEDFGQFGNVYGSQKEISAFKNIEEFIDKYPSLYIPSVETSSNGFVSNLKDWEVEELDADTMDKLNLMNASENALVVVNLPSTVTASNRREAIQKNDKLVGQVLNRLHDLEKFSVIFTGQQPSWATNQEDHVRISRHILEMNTNDSVPGYFVYDNRTMFHVLNVTFLVAKNETDPVRDLLKLGEADSYTANDTIWFSFNATGDEVDAFSASFEFTRTSASWFLKSLIVDVRTKISGGSGTFDVTPKDVWAPLGMSFTCKNLRNVVDNNKTIGVVFDSLQIQPMFNFTGNVFGDAFDCVGFFTVPIWMSIFVSIILILILAYGVSMLMSINTNDRFDDPKGKTITVPAVD